MVKSFEELTQGKTEEAKPAPSPVNLEALAWASVLIYIALTVFLPFVLASTSKELVAPVPLLFTVTFFILTLIFLAAWAVWIRLFQKQGQKINIKMFLPVLAIPLAIGWFYLLAWIFSLQH